MPRHRRKSCNPRGRPRARPAATGIDGTRYWQCSDCDDVKPESEFHSPHCRRARKPVRSYCKECSRIRDRDYDRMVRAEKSQGNADK